MTSAKTIKLSANENHYGCSPFALEAIRKNIENVHFYPEINPIALKELLAVKFGVSVNNIIVGAGSVRIIDGLIQTFVGPGEEVLTFEKSFVAYGQFSEFHRRKCNFAPLSDFRCTPENLIPFINDRTRLIFIANPNNPTGTIISHAELDAFLNKISPNIIVALDEAYAEYVTDSSFPNTIELQKKHTNLVVLRSFSKIYGLAGLRIGYAMMEEGLAIKMTEGQIPFSLNYLSGKTAIAALNDYEFILKSAEENAIQCAFLYDELINMGYNIIPSQANYLYLWFSEDAEKDKLYQNLRSNGILVCDMNVFNQPKSLRIGIGDRDACIRIIECLRKQK